MDRKGYSQLRLVKEGMMGSELPGMALEGAEVNVRGRKGGGEGNEHIRGR